MILDWLERAVKEGVSDIFIGAGRRVAYKKNGVIVPQEGEILKPDDSKEIITGLYEMARRSMNTPRHVRSAAPPYRRQPPLPLPKRRLPMRRGYSTSSFRRTRTVISA